MSYFEDQQKAWESGGREWYAKHNPGAPIEGIPGDFDPFEFWAEDESRSRKASNEEWSVNYLKEKGYQLVLLNAGNGHYRIGDWDFWPRTGMFLNRKTSYKARGVKNLERQLSTGKQGDGSL